VWRWQSALDLNGNACFLCSVVMYLLVIKVVVLKKSSEYHGAGNWAANLLRNETFNSLCWWKQTVVESRFLVDKSQTNVCLHVETKFMCPYHE
jgi:hypothetical protein